MVEQSIVIAWFWVLNRKLDNLHMVGFGVGANYMPTLIDVLPLTRLILGPFETSYFLLSVRFMYRLASCQHLLNQTKLESESWQFGFPIRSKEASYHSLTPRPLPRRCSSLSVSYIRHAEYQVQGRMCFTSF